MSYEETLDKKNKILCAIIGISVLLRCITNSFFISFSSLVPFAAVCLVVVVILGILIKVVKSPIVMMYLMVIAVSSINIALMVLYPCMVNYLMFILDIFFIIIYEAIRPIAFQCLISIGSIIYFYFTFTEELHQTWTVTAMAMLVVYIVSGLLVFIALCKINKDSFTYLAKVNMENIQAKEKSDILLQSISQSVKNLSTINDDVKESITNIDDMTKEIVLSSETVSQKVTDEVDAVEVIKNLVQEGTSQMEEVSDSSNQMTKASNQTDEMVSTGNAHVNQLSTKMNNVNVSIEDIERSIGELNGENSKIIEIINSLKEIASQTNLLALNASIEAARAGENGKGFAVVADEIRKLAVDSNQFNEQINQIIDGVNVKTKRVVEVISIGKEQVGQCDEFAKNVKDSFEIISKNSKIVLSQSLDIDEKSQRLSHLFENATSDIQSLHENAESTADAMESITGYVEKMNKKMNVVVEGYDDINEITKSLVEVSN